MIKDNIMDMNAMKQALHSTRAGRLAEALSFIQNGLTGRDRRRLPEATKPVVNLTPLPLAKTLPDPAAPEPPRAPVAAGRFVECRYSGTAGVLEYRLYLPPDCGPGLPLVVMLHGCTQSPEDFACGTGMNRLAEKAGLMVAYPRQSTAANAQKCWNWFRPSDQERDGGEAALITGMVDDICREHGADRSRVYLAGLSAGGAAAANLAAYYPDVFAAVAIHSGLAHGAARNLPAALYAMHRGSIHTPVVAPTFVPTITFHGERDKTVNPVNSDQVVAAATAAYGTPLSTTSEDGGKSGGRQYTHTVSRDTAGKSVIEQWTIAGAGHAWSGGDPSGTYTDPTGPDASAEMLRFFLQHELHASPVPG